MHTHHSNEEKSATAIVRVIVSIFVGIVAAAITGICSSWAYAPLVRWDIAALTFLIWIWHTLHGRDAEGTAALATREDPSHTTTDIILICASVASLVAVGLLLVQVHKENGLLSLLLSALCVLSVIISWAMIHAIYTLNYARMFYGDVGSIDFNDTKLPRYSDFLYMSFTIGMTFQVSDTQIKSSAIRKTILHQALLSYVFGTVIIAITINFIAGLGK